MKISIKKLYIGLEEVAMIVDLGVTTLYKLVREGTFPAPRMTAGRRVAWLLREVEEWAENRPVSNLLPPENTGKRKAKAEANPRNDQQAA